MAGPQVVVEMTGDESKLYQAWQSIINQQVKAEKGLKDNATAAKKAAREQAELGRAAKRVLNEIRTPQERYNQKLKELSTLLKANKLNQDQYGRAVARANSELRNAQTAGQGAFGSKALGMVKQFAGALGITGGVAGAVAAVNQGYQVWLQNIREIGEEAKKAGDEVIAFAALQEGGTKAARVGRAARLGARYGITDRGQAFNAVQAMQSTLGDFEQGMKAAETIFAAKQAGIPVPQGLELEVLGAAQQQAPGDALRRAYAAGEASGRTPATLAKAAAGLTFWKDKEIGMAAAGVLSGAVPEEQLATYVKRGGTALTTTASLQGQFTKWGMGEASQLDRIRELSKRKITTPEALEKLGLEDIRESLAVATLAANLPYMEQMLGEIREKAKPGLFARKRAGVEKELPTFREKREIEELQALFQHETAFGPAAPKALKVERRQRLRALSMRRLGAEQAAWFDLITPDEQGGRTTRGDLAQMFMGQVLTLGAQDLPGLAEINRDMARVEKDRRMGRAIRPPLPRAPLGPQFPTGYGEAMGYRPNVGMPAGFAPPPVADDTMREMVDQQRQTNQKLDAIRSDGERGKPTALAPAGHDPEGN